MQGNMAIKNPHLSFPLCGSGFHRFGVKVSLRFISLEQATMEIPPLNQEITDLNYKKLLHTFSDNYKLL